MIPLVAAIAAASPSWHRRARHRRSTARKLIKNFRTAPKLRLVQKVKEAILLLEAHHSQPRYKMPWVANYDYGTWDAQTWWGEPKVKKEKGKGKGRGKGKDTAVEKTAKGKKKE